MALSFTAVAEVADPASLPDTIYPETPMQLTITSEVKSTLASDRITYRARCTKCARWRITSRGSRSRGRSCLTGGSPGQCSRLMVTCRYSRGEWTRCDHRDV